MTKLTTKISNIVFGDVIGRGFNFATSVYLARILGKEGFGIITIAMAFLSYSIWTADMGLKNIGAREMAKSIENRVYRSREIFFLKTALGIAVLAVIRLIIPYFDITTTEQELILRFCYSLIPYGLLLEWYFSGRQQFGMIAISKSVFGAVYFLLVIVLIKSPMDLLSVPTSYSLAVLASAIVLLLIALPNKPFAKPIRGFTELKELFKSALSIGSGSFFGQLMQFAPPLLIGFFLANNDAGLYGAAFRIIIIGMMIDRVFTNLLLPNFTAQWVSNPKMARVNMLHTIRVMLILAGSVVLVLAVLAPWIISFLFGEEYADSAPLLSILSLFLFFTLLNSIFSFGLIGMGKDREYFRVMASGGSIAFGLMALAAWQFDLIHLAWAVSLGEGVIASLSFYRFSKYMNVAYLRGLFITLSVGALLFTASSLLSLNLFLEAGLTMCIFIGLMIVTRVITVDDFRWITAKLWR